MGEKDKQKCREKSRLKWLHGFEDRKGQGKKSSARRIALALYLIQANIAIRENNRKIT